MQAAAHKNQAGGDQAQDAQAPGADPDQADQAADDSQDAQGQPQASGGDPDAVENKQQESSSRSSTQRANGWIARSKERNGCDGA